jgi:hypothetical protein
LTYPASSYSLTDMTMWPELTETQKECQDIAHDVLGKEWPNTWTQVEEKIREAFLVRARARGGNEDISNAYVDMLLEEELHLIWPIIRRFFTQR